MFLKLVVFGFFAATLVQSQSAPLNPQVAGGIFDEYVGLIRNELSAAASTLSNSTANLRSQVDLIGNELQATLKADCSILLQELQVLLGRANSSGVDVNACIANAERRIIDLSVKYGNQITSCQESIVNEGTSINNEATIEVESLNQQLNIIVDRYNGCAGVSTLSCRTEAIALANKASVGDSWIISKYVGRVAAFNLSLKASLENCGLRYIQVAVSEGQGIINEIAACIDSKIKPIPFK